MFGPFRRHPAPPRRPVVRPDTRTAPAARAFARLADEPTSTEAILADYLVDIAIEDLEWREAAPRKGWLRLLAAVDDLPGDPPALLGVTDEDVDAGLVHRLDRDSGGETP